jgi:hypothetical protein
MPVTFTNYLEQISFNLDAHDGPKLAYLLRVTGPHVKDLLREFKNPTVSTSQSRDPPLAVREPITKMLVCRLRHFRASKGLLKARGTR